jgi:redox-sensitive bicupin YhaK (pirin superfamily)
MSQIDLIIQERARKIGHFWVGRLLPFSQKRMVGPFIYIDHMGPVLLAADEAFDVAPHPHIGLSTLTFLLEGEILHRDSLGTVQRISPGAVNWMTAGSGIVHSERSPADLRNKPQPIHGLQIWVALPEADEEVEPYFYHAESADLPAWQGQGANFRLIAGVHGQHKSPVPVHSPLFLLEITTADQAAEIQLGQELFGEVGLYIINGSLEIENTRFGPRQLLVSQQPSLCRFEMAAHSRVYVFGGEPFENPRYIDWNFVSSRPNRIDQARSDWQAGRFGQVSGEFAVVPMPDRPKSFKWV